MDLEIGHWIIGFILYIERFKQFLVFRLNETVEKGFVFFIVTYRTPVEDVINLSIFKKQSYYCSNYLHLTS